MPSSPSLTKNRCNTNNNTLNKQCPYLDQAFLDRGLLAVVPAFAFVAAAFFTGAFFAATLAFAAGVAPVTAFFAAPRFAGALVFFVVAVALALPASTFFGAAFFASTFFTTALGAAAALAAAGFFTDAGLAAVFDGGLLFYKYPISINPPFTISSFTPL